MRIPHRLTVIVLVALVYAVAIGFTMRLALHIGMPLAWKRAFGPSMIALFSWWMLLRLVFGLMLALGFCSVLKIVVSSNLIRICFFLSAPIGLFYQLHQLFQFKYFDPWLRFQTMYELFMIVLALPMAALLLRSRSSVWR
jgi:hypothetical protein